MLTRENARGELGAVQTVIVDEWHELIGSKRGVQVQVQLALARLRRWNPALVVWGLSATIGSLPEAMITLTGPGGQLVQGRSDKALSIDTLLPKDPGRFSWGGHLGAQMLQPVVDEIDRSGTTLVFTNTRSQAEIWYQLLLQARPDWAGVVALHHGSLDRKVREWVEAGLKQGTLKAVVATSSLDLGVDFLPVERVLQIGSAKGVARLLQRAGRVLEFVRTHEMAAQVRLARKVRGVVPSWAGGKMPLSSEMAASVQALLDEAAQGQFSEPEMQAAMPMLQAQARLSLLPRLGTLLVEELRTRNGHHLFVYPFAGRNVHIGLAQLLAWRLAQGAPNTFSLSVNDYGLEILAATDMGPDSLLRALLFDSQNLLHDVLASLNSGQLAQRRFREIARVAGLEFGGYPGAPKSLRQLQASSSLFFEVFRKYDAGNRLLGQAQSEVLTQELELSRLTATLQTLCALPQARVALAAPSPFALPLMVDRLREQLSTEKLKDRLERLLARSEAALLTPPRRRQRTAEA